MNAPLKLDTPVERIRAFHAELTGIRHDIHAHPELGFTEQRTSDLVAAKLEGWDIEVHRGLAKTGLVGVVKGRKSSSGRAVGLRADMDCLPMHELNNMPYKSGNPGCMHACGHDSHVAMLLGAAEVLAKMKAELGGTVVFIFQPAEEGPPAGEAGGAPLMVAEGAIANPKPEAIFGLHVWPDEPGKITYRPKGAMSASDQIDIVVRGKQTHGAQAWRGVDPIVVSAQIISALQTITARQTDITLAPAVVTIGMVTGGIRRNIIPDSVIMQGTIRTFDNDMRKDVLMRVRRTAERIAEASGATALVTYGGPTDVVYNDPALTARMAPSLERAASGKVNASGLWMPSEDFPAFTKEIPGLYVFLGVNAVGVSAYDAAPNHSPKFFVNEDALPVGVKAYVALAMDYLKGAPGRIP